MFIFQFIFTFVELGDNIVGLFSFIHPQRTRNQYSLINTLLYYFNSRLLRCFTSQHMVICRLWRYVKLFSGTGFRLVPVCVSARV